ncbi:hypothetical protein FC72_GL001855 [Companilactobacillus tucceti DSM 20183]|uniref:DUF3923 family protein n=1 Tax=Companilactobacillus tucceti DSM 20183 TaxID=1423811 RepID=A0A0R1J8N9_9LACO|nr:hypothetical protein FC72_GL001855 [Companilactobacillus tucceti DSM 20183]
MSKWRIFSLSWLVIFVIGAIIISAHSYTSVNNPSTLKLGGLFVWIGIFILISILQTVAYTIYNLLLHNKTPH